MIERDCKSITGEYRRKMLSSVVFLLLLLGLVSPVSAGFNSIYQGFESGSLPVNNFTTQEESSESSIDVQSGSGGCSVSPNEGSYSLVMDTDTSGGYSANELVTTANFTDARNIQLEFYHRETGDEEDSASDHSGSFPAQDGFYYTTDGNNWKSLGSLGNVGSTWTQESVNISADSDFSGPANSSFAIKLVQYDNYDCTTDGRMFDSINITWESGPDVEWARIRPRADGISDVDARNLQGYDASAFLETSGDSMNGDLDMNGNSITEFFGSGCSPDLVNDISDTGSLNCNSGAAETLADTLSEGNEAGDYNINMTGNNITGVSWLNPRKDWKTGGSLEQRFVNGSISLLNNNTKVPLERPRFVAYENDFVYVTSYGSDAFTVVNVSDPSDISIAGTNFSVERPIGVDVNGSYAYVSTDDYEMKVFDVSNPESPVITGNTSVAGGNLRPFALDSQGGHAYITADQNFSVVDVSDPSNPTEIAKLQTIDAYHTNNDVEVEGDFAYVANKKVESSLPSYFFIVNVSNPSDPEVVGNLSTDEEPFGSLNLFGVDVNGSYAYVSAGSTLNVIDVSDPTNPVMVENVTNSSALSGAGDVEFEDGIAYVAGGTSDTVAGFDVSNPSNPSLEGYIQKANDELLGAYGLAANNTQVYASARLGDLINSIDVSTPSNPVLQDSIQGILGGLQAAVDIELRGDKAFVGGDFFTIVDIGSSDLFRGVGRANPVKSSFDTFTDLEVAGSTVYGVSSGLDAFYTVNISDPSNPETVTNLTAVQFDGPAEVEVAGSYAYVANDLNDSVVVVDISNPENPSVVGEVADSTNLNDVESIEVRGDYVYAAASQKFSVVDISDPSNPSITGTESANINLYLSWEVEIDGKYAYVNSDSDNEERLNVIDISDPSNPNIVGSVADSDLLTTGNGIEKLGSYVYVAANSDDSITVVDVSDPSSPSIVGSYQDGVNAEDPDDIRIQGGRAFVVSSFKPRLRSLELTSFDTPTASIGSLRTGEIHVDDKAMVDGSLSIGSSMSVGSRGIKSDGRIAAEGLETTGTKNFVQPVNETHLVEYTSSESGEAVVEYSATGLATPAGNFIELPRHYREVLSSREDYQVLVTPLESLQRVIVEERNRTGFILKSETETTEVDFHVRGVREGFEDVEVWRKG